MPRLKALPNSPEYEKLEWFEKLGMQIEAWPQWRVWTHELKINAALRFPYQAPELIDDVTMIERQMAGRSTPGWQIKPFHQALLRHVAIEYMGGTRP